MVEYHFWDGNQKVRANGLIEIRKKFIQRYGKNKVANIFKGANVVGHIYYATGSWIYRDYVKLTAYIIKENGRVEYQLQHRFY